ncbi:predicted protein [Streptomyces viridosporus ATCC 14672]|uniref:Predicted protein n=1 Tax=Streptomyces viridosporus (strain ATCC 14672 / DSM 40746 / JCM 4963 / KCTC 9882 / NRRL B-12104 / FH 1290) TaxID=566461 RepID=D6AAS0_STRV1|nr:predicted protein [Streptomyces viridosporus ATCC 14672]
MTGTPSMAAAPGAAGEQLTLTSRTASSPASPHHAPAGGRVRCRVRDPFLRRSRIAAHPSQTFRDSFLGQQSSRNGIPFLKQRKRAIRDASHEPRSSPCSLLLKRPERRIVTLNWGALKPWWREKRMSGKSG